MRQRQEVLDVAYQRSPGAALRTKRSPTHRALPSEVWINKPVSTPEPSGPVATGGATKVGMLWVDRVADRRCQGDPGAKFQVENWCPLIKQ